MSPAQNPFDFHHADTTRGPCVAVIAEIGVNHDGNPQVAQRLIADAAKAGADAVKFQYFDPDRLLSDRAELAGYQQGQADDARSLLEPLRLNLDALRPLREAAAQHGVAFVVTPFSPQDVPELAALQLDAVKIASPDAVNPMLLDAVAELDVPVIVSTGTCELDELEHAATVVRLTGGALLQCVSAYPTPMASAGLGGMAALRERFGVPVGYSDHTPAIHTAALAVSAGACVLEKHLTHDRHANGPDHAASLEPQALASYTAQAREAADALGPLQKTCDGLERDVRHVSRQSLAPARDLPAGHTLTANDLTTRRPGNGIPAAQRDEILGKTLQNPVRRGTLLTPDDLAP